jgi:glycosyltransferase involved in cell wall biosynthesis
VNLKILFVLGLANPFPGAAWARIGFFAKKWSSRGYMVEVLGSFSYKALHKRGAFKEGRVNIFNMVFSMGLTHPIIFLSNFLISLPISTIFMLARGPNIVIVSFPPGDVGLGSLMACRLAKRKRVVDYRDEWEDYTISLVSSKFAKFFYRAVKRLATSLYAKSEFVATVTPNLVKSLMGRGVSNVRLIPNGADTKTFKPAQCKRNKEFFEIIYSGSVGGYYRLDVAVRALKRLREYGMENIKLTIVSGGEVDRVLDLANKLEVYNFIEYKGVINDKRELSKLIAEADVGLIPYDDNPLWKNSLPAKFFEYCACGIPVIATAYDDALLAKFIRGYEIGLIAPPMDDERLAEAIYQIYHNQEFRKLAGKRARTLIEGKFDRNKIAEEFLRLVEGCVDVGRK